jgi:hypothetical protein
MIMSRKHTHSKHVAEPASHRRQKIHKRNLAWLWVGLGALLVAVVGILLLRPKAALSIEITPAQAYAKFQQGVFILDVRSQEEWDQFHIAGSTLIPLDQLPRKSDKADRIVPYSPWMETRSGPRLLRIHE